MNQKNEENDNAVYTIKENWDQQWLDTAIDYDPDWEVVSVWLWSLFKGGSELSTVVPLPTLSLCFLKKHSLAQNSLGRGLFYAVNVLRYFKIA